MLLCTSCVQSDEVHCADGRLCPPGYTCDNDQHRCVSPEQLAACDGQADGAPCTFGGAMGACQMGKCEPLICGDGTRSFGEACDGADLGDADCTTAGFYEPDGLACTSFCTFDVTACSGFCGDNKINGDELCDGAAPGGTCFDLGFDAGAVSCAAGCGYSFASCGRFGWLPEPVGMAQVTGFAGTGTGDLWAIGQDLTGTAMIAHYDGSAWTRESAGSMDLLTAVEAITPTDVWIATEGVGVGVKSRPRHFDGAQWSVVASAPLAEYTDVWAASSTAVYFATRDAGVQWWNGSTWQQLGTTPQPLVAIDGSSANDIWAVQADGTLLRWNGTMWQAINAPVLVRHLDVRSATSVWLVGPNPGMTAATVAHFDGTMFTTYSDSSTSSDVYTSVLAIADNDVWVAGPLGLVRHYDGHDWIDSVSRVTTDSTTSFVEMKRFGDVVIGAAFNGFVHRYRGQYVGRNQLPTNVALVSLWSSGPNDTFVGDQRSSVYRYDGSDWTRYTLDTTTITSFGALWGSGPNDVWVVGSGTGGSGKVYRWNGNAWNPATTIGTGVNVIWGTGPTDVWFFGTSVTHYNGSSYVPVTTGVGNVSAASASGPNDIWLVSQESATSTKLAHWNGNAWSVTTLPHDIRAIIALAPNDVFATADNNHILHYDGAAWSDTIVTVASRLEYIAASARDDIIAASTSEAVHFDGTTWTPFRIPFESPTSVVRAVTIAPAFIDILYSGVTGQVVRRVTRTRFWNCRASETGCNDGVDDDCDGDVDIRDTNC